MSNNRVGEVRIYVWQILLVLYIAITVPLCINEILSCAYCVKKGSFLHIITIAFMVLLIELLIYLGTMFALFLFDLEDSITPNSYFKFKIKFVMKRFIPQVFLKATSFMLLPTLTFLGLLFVWFLDWAKFVGFVGSDGGWAATFRVIMVLIEIGLVWYMYEIYYIDWLASDTARQSGNKKISFEKRSAGSIDMDDIFPGIYSNDDVNVDVTLIDNRTAIVKIQKV